MKHQYISAKRLSLWMRLTQKWNALYNKLQENRTSKSLKRLNSISLLLGIKRKVVFTVFAGVVTLGVQAQEVMFDEVTDRSEQYFHTSSIDVGLYSSPVFADLDGDGDQDLVLGEWEGSIKYYLNTGNGFDEQTADNNPFEDIDFGYRSMAAFVDLDGDSDLDLVVGNVYGYLDYYINTENNFSKQLDQNNPFSDIEVEEYSTPVFADLDGDGDQDLVLGEREGVLSYFTNDTGVFTEQLGVDNPFAGIDVGAYSSPTFIDLDGDSDLDLIVGKYEGSLNYFSNNNNIFTEELGVNNPLNGIDENKHSRPAFVDIDGDGDQDLILGETYGSLFSYLNTNRGFSKLVGVANPFGALNVYRHATPNFLDLDGDGDLDLVSGNSFGEFQYFTNINNSFEEVTGTDNPFDKNDSGFLSTTAFVDIDGDGDLDLVSGQNNGDIFYFKNTDNVFTVQTDESNPFDEINVGFESVPTFIDLDGDGDQDMVSGEEYGTLKYFVNENNVFTEQFGTDNPFDFVNVGYYSAPVFVDLDKDGDSDLVLGDTYGRISYFTNDANNFTEQTGLNNPFDGIDVGTYSKPAFADLDGDGDLDLFVGEYYGYVVEFRNTSIITGIFSNEKIETLNIYPNPASTVINTEEGQLEIVDGLGNEVLSTESRGVVDVSSLETGIYFVTQSGKKTKLIIE